MADLGNDAGKEHGIGRGDDLHEEFSGGVEAQWSMAAASMRKSLHEIDKVPFAWSLTDLDLAAVSLSALSEETNYMVAPPPVPARQSSSQKVRHALSLQMLPGDILVVDSESNSLFFYHVVNAAVLNGQVRKEQLPAVLKTGFVTIDETAYVEYLDMHQHAVRAMYSNPERYRADAILLLSAMNSRYLDEGKAGLFGALRPMLDIVGHNTNGLFYSMMTMPFQQRLMTGGGVLIPGAGYNSLLNLEAFKQANAFDFILNDNDPLVAPVLERVITHMNRPNVQFIPGDMKDLPIETRSLDFAVLSQLYSASPDSAAGLISMLSKALKPQSPVALMQPVKVEKPAHTPLSTWQKLLTENGFCIELDHRTSGEGAALVPGNDQAKTRAMSGAELMEVMRSMHTTKREVMEYGFLIARLS